MSMIHAGQRDAVPGNLTIDMASLRSLPLWAQVAVERLDACAELRNQTTLDELLTSYARTYGSAVPPEIRSAVRQVCRLRFRESYITSDDTDSQYGDVRAKPDPAVAERRTPDLLQHAEPLVALSTMHLSPSTLRRLADGNLSVHAYPNDCGGFLYVGDPGGSIPSEPELLNIVSLAHRAGIVWIKFDADAAELDGLPTYADEEISG